MFPQRQLMLQGCKAKIGASYNVGFRCTAKMMQAQAGDDMSEEALLDWLCLHVDPADLPKRFAGESMSRRAAAGIKVMSIADDKVAAQKR